jgi:hypothetical protein
MRTKTLLLTAALCAAGIATSKAQVYSVNAVGYVNTTLVPGFNLVSNPLDNKAPNGNTIASLFAGLPEGSAVYKFVNGAYVTASYEFGQFDPPAAANTTVTPGEGVFVKIPAGAGNKVITFVGEVPQGKLDITIPKGFSIISSKVPQAGTATSLGFPATEGDQVYVYDEAAQKYVTSSYEFGAWDKDPQIDVGDAFFVRTEAAKTWTRTFNITQ